MPGCSKRGQTSDAKPDAACRGVTPVLPRARRTNRRKSSTPGTATSRRRWGGMNAPDIANRFGPLPEPHARRRHRMPFGAELGPDGTSFRLWAPLHDAIGLMIEGESGPRAMAAGPDGWHVLHAADVGPGALYKFVLPGGVAVPDPASRFQPRDVHGPSEVVDPSAYAWKTPHWRGRPWEECILYELHVGAFTPQGTFLAAARTPRSPRGARRHRDRIDAGRRLPRRSELGLRRRFALCAGLELRPAGRLEGARRRRPRARV